MTLGWWLAIVCTPRRWDSGSPAGPRPSAGAGGCSPIPRPAWRPDQPSAGASDLQPRTWRGRSRGLPRRTLEDKGVRIAAKPVSGTPHGMVARPAKRRAAVGGGRAGRSSRPSPDIGHGLRARAWTPCSSLHRLGRPSRCEDSGAFPSNGSGACGSPSPRPSPADGARGKVGDARGEGETAWGLWLPLTYRHPWPANPPAPARATAACRRSAPRRGRRC
jgi:hypothetical protein